MMNISVEQGEFAVAEYGYTISTGAAGPCILVGIYDKKNNRAYLIHEDSAAYNGKLGEFIEKVKFESASGGLVVKVRGGSLSMGNHDVVKLNREAVIIKLEELPKPTICDIKWRESCMEIDSVTGQFKLKC